MGGLLSLLPGLEPKYDETKNDTSKNCSTKDQGHHQQMMTVPQLLGQHTPPTSDGDGDDDDEVQVETSRRVAPTRWVTPKMIHQVGNTMLEEHRVPNRFRDAIVHSVLETKVGGARDDLLSDDDWTAIRSAELRLLFLVAIKSSMSLGRQFNFTASSEYSFVSPQLKQAQLINGGMFK